MKKEETELEEQEEEPTKPEPLIPIPGLPEPSLSPQTLEELDSGKEKEAIKKIEAALFISGKYMSIPELVALTDINPLMLKELIKKLDENYEIKNSSLEIIEQSGLFKMDVKAEYVNMINKLATGNSEFSRAEQETLAIIAYKQPIKQSIIVKIRGNKAYDHIKNFSQLGLIRAKKLGHTKELSLSDNFYDYFNIDEKGEQEKQES